MFYTELFLQCAHLKKYCELASIKCAIVGESTFKVMFHWWLKRTLTCLEIVTFEKKLFIHPIIPIPPISPILGVSVTLRFVARACGPVTARGISDVTISRRAGPWVPPLGCIRIRVGLSAVCGPILMGHWGGRAPGGVSSGQDRAKSRSLPADGQLVEPFLDRGSPLPVGNW